MINAILVFNNSGQPRLTKFYTQLDTPTQQSLLSQIFALVSARPPSSCNFLPLPPLLSPPNPTNPTSLQPPSSDSPSQITYRHYATLYFILISTATESPLALLDFIQVFVEALDRLFSNVCELDLIFGFESLHAVLGEMVVGGCVVETDLGRIVRGVREANPKAIGRGRGGKEGDGGSLGLGAGLGMGGIGGRGSAGRWAGGLVGGLGAGAWGR